MQIPLHIWFEIGAFVVSLWCYRTIKDSTLKWFIPFLFALVCLELVTNYMAFVLKMHTVQVYNFSMPIEYSFYAFLFYKHLQGPMIKKVALGLLIFILTFSAINLAFVQGIEDFNSVSQMLGCAVVLFLSCSFFVDLFRREEEISLLREPMFWIATGVLFFNLGELSTILFWQYTYQNPNPVYPAFLHMINKSLIYVLYTFISIGLLCTKKPYRQTLDKSSWSAY
jgi:hypothetical protein